MSNQLLGKIILVLLILIWFFSLITSFAYPSVFEQMVIEDGVIENLTVLVLFVALCLSIFRFIKHFSVKSWMWKGTMLGLCLFLLFGFGEEISWGQRIFDIPSDEFFQEKNTQGEINIHNLKLGGIKLNFLISQVFTILLSIYLILFPFVYRKKEGFKNFINQAGIPIPSKLQIIVMISSIVLMLIIQHGQKWEVLEISLALGGFLILLNPLNNKEIYQ